MPNRISELAVVHPDVELDDDATVEPWAILGYRPPNAEPGPALRIGRGAVIRSHAVIYAGSTIGAHFHAGHGALIRESNDIGDDVSVGSHSIIEHHVRLADGVRIHSGAFIPEHSILEAGAWVGPHVVFTNAPYPLAPDAKRTLKGPHLMAGSRIGANATLLPGVVIGADALVGAGSVVVRDVPEGQVVVGNPARLVRSVREIAAYRRTEAIDDGRPE